MFTLNYQAIDWIFDTWIRRIIETLLLIIPTKFRDCPVSNYKEKVVLLQAVYVEQIIITSGTCFSTLSRFTVDFVV